MSIQRTGAQMTTMVHKIDPEKAFVLLEVQVKGRIEDRGDALLMVVDAWCQLMTEAGFDPDKSFHTMRNHGRLN